MKFYITILVLFLICSCQKAVPSFAVRDVDYKEINTQKSTPHKLVQVCLLPSAPILIHADVEDGSATIFITFHRYAKNVSIQIYGTKALMLSENKTRLTGGNFDKGEGVHYFASFPKESNQGRLAVHVSAEFDQRMQSKTCSFALPYSNQEAYFKEEIRKVKIDPHGRSLRTISITPVKPSK